MTITEQSKYVRQKRECILKGEVTYFYMYVHIRKDTDEPFYVGKGSGSRAWNTKSRNKYWKNTANKHGVITQIIFDNLTEAESLQCEIDTILEYNYIGYKICNLSSGGDNPVFCKETRQRMSDSRMGMKRTKESVAKTAEAHKGMKRSAETCKRISEALTGKPRKDREAVLRGNLKRSGASSTKSDKTIYRFLNEDATVFTGCRYEFIAKYTYMKKALSHIFGKSPKQCIKGWTLVKENETDAEVMLRFIKPVRVGKIREFMNKDGSYFKGTHSDFCKEYLLSRNNSLCMFNTKQGSNKTYKDWYLVKEINDRTD